MNGSFGSLFLVIEKQVIIIITIFFDYPFSQCFEWRPVYVRIDCQWNHDCSPHNIAFESKFIFNVYLIFSLIFILMDFKLIWDSFDSTFDQIVIKFNTQISDQINKIF